MPTKEKLVQVSGNLLEATMILCFDWQPTLKDLFCSWHRLDVQAYTLNTVLLFSWMKYCVQYMQNASKFMTLRFFWMCVANESPSDSKRMLFFVQQNYSVLDVGPPPTVITLNNSMYWQEFDDACVYECLDGKDCQSFFCCYEECKDGAWRKGRVHIDILELDAYSRVFFPTSFLLFNIVYWVGYLYL